MSLSYHTHEERAAWELAESQLQQARAMMREAEKAMDDWRTGKEMNRLRCERRGIGKTDAEIRWAGSATAKNAITNNTFHVGLATMYYNAATANYARALYLHTQQDARL